MSKPLTFDQWNRGEKAEEPRVFTATLEASQMVHKVVGVEPSVWTADVQRLETFRRQCLCDPPYKKPGWRPKA